MTRHLPRRAGPRRSSSLRAVVAAVTAAAAVIGVMQRLGGAPARADEVTISQDNLRNGWDPNEPGLAPSVVESPGFGQLFKTPVSGQVVAQPVVAGSTVIVATENDYVYGLNAVTGAVNWSDNLGPAEPSSAQGCINIKPSVGITSTPVYDPSTGTIYLVALVNDGPSVGEPHVYLYALDAQTGAVHWRVTVQGSPVNSPGETFNPLSERQRTGLLLVNGTVYIGFASYCDYPAYVGYVAGVNTTTKALTLWSDEAGLTDTNGGIWQSGSGLMSDGNGRIFFTSGNGVSPAASPGSKPPQELGDSTVRLSVGSGGVLSAADYFSPANAPALDARDADFGSGGPVGLPFGTSTYPDLLVQAGKDGRVFLLNRDNLGGREQGPGGTDADVSMSGPFNRQFGHPAAFGPTASLGSAGPATSDDYVYYVGTNDNLRYLQFGLNSSGTPVLTDVANSTVTFPYLSGSPVVTSSGGDPASATVWEIARKSSSSMLEAFAGEPATSCTATSQCSMSPIWSAPIGSATEFSVPATDSGRVYVGTQDGNVYGFGSPDAAPLGGAAPVNFGQVAVNSTSAAQQVTLTATRAVTITGVSTASATASDPFSATAPATPVPLAAGQSITVPVTFSPTAPGGAAGSLNFATDSANFPIVGVGLTGNGTQSGFYANPGSLSFGSLPVGIGTTLSLTIANGGTTSETVRSVSPPAGAFTATGLPKAGQVIAPGMNVPATVTYKPAAAGSGSSSLSVTGTDTSGHADTLTVQLSGSGTGDVTRFSTVPSAVNFGSVPLGQQATQTIDLTNAGNLPATITGTAPPPVPFGAPQPIAAGLPVNPGYDLHIPVTFTPASTGPVSRAYRLTWSDVSGTHTLTIPVTGTGTAPASGIAVPPPGGGWTLNGSARMSGTTLQLTQAVPGQAGSAVYAVPVASNGLKATFTARIGGGTGADGMTFSLLNAASSGPGSLGHAAGGIGFGGLHGVAITLNTHKDAGYPSANFIGIATGQAGSGLKFAATATNVPNLRRGSHTVTVTVSGPTGQTITVSVDGKTALSRALPAGTVPASVLPAFTGGTGGLDDVHSVTSASIRAGGSLPEPGGGWSFNGTAQMSGSDTVLTQAVQGEAGSAVYPHAVRTLGLKVQFDAQLSGGTGADGLTFALLDPAKSSATSLGGSGGGLGFGGLSGVAVTLDTWKDPGFPANNFVGLSSSAKNGLLQFQTWARVIPPLRIGTQTVEVEVVADSATGVSAIVVYLDGERVLTRDEPGLTTTSLLAFTGGTGGMTDLHIVRDAAIAATG